MADLPDTPYLAAFRSLGTALQVTLRTGAELLQPEVLATVKRALAGGLADRTGHAAAENGELDLYYSLFACMLCEALQLPIERSRLHVWLSQCAAWELDPVHRACHTCLTVRTQACSFALRMRLLPAVFRDFRSGLHDPYAAFIAALTAEQCGWRPCWFALAWWAPWTWGTTPQAAAVLAIQALAGAALERGRNAQRWLTEQIVASGGFRVGPQARHADLLSTATARFALALAGWRESDDDARRLMEFVDSCRAGDGHWSGQPGAGRGDVEYDFYALLALGAAFVYD